MEINSNYVKKLDLSDSLSSYRKKYHLPKTKSGESFIYFCGNSLGLQTYNASTYINEVLDSWKKYGVEGHFNKNRPWMPYHEFLTKYSAELVGALDEEVVVLNSLTVNLHLLMISFYRPIGKKKKILIENNAFPSDKYAVESQLKFHKNNPINDLIIMQPDKGELISTHKIIEYIEKYGHEIAMILIGGVNYLSGQAFNMKKITQKAHKHGCLVGYDLAHATGNLEMHLHDWGVDFASWCGYKYLNGGPGAPSGIFIHKRHLGKKNIPRLEGWWGHDKFTRFKMPDKFTPIDTAEAWQLSNPSIFAMAPLLASLEIFHDAGISNLRDKSIKQIKYLEFLLNKLLEGKIRIITPTKSDARGCQLSIQILEPVEDIIDKLYKLGVIVDWREPDIIRIAPVPLYNTYEDCFNFVQKLKNILEINIQG